MTLRRIPHRADELWLLQLQVAVLDAIVEELTASGATILTDADTGPVPVRDVLRHCEARRERLQRLLSSRN